MNLTGVKTTETQARQAHAVRHSTPNADELLQAVERLMIALATHTTTVQSEPVATSAPIATNAPIISRTAQNAVSYHLNSGGQKVRARLALYAARRLGLLAEDAIAIAAATELLNNASFIHDDLQDRDVIRRNRQTV